ncbi:uncharacterized protein LOC132201626 isoform X2 [Neocloeon triangulifer]|uniref:uncharacterized protein LOC132201626 isoform X2 n=1 Tax=Neocloeon triangulifer TaxID=2078957 RepID=UPI00286FA42D|nr:uncharacterized protein LOC132201626 isoform X2 [Neocloeon triangulifer]
MSPAAIIFSAVTFLAVFGTALGEANGDYLTPDKRSNERPKTLSMFPRIGRTKEEEMQKNWRGMMKLFPRVGRSGGGADEYDEHPLCPDCYSPDYMNFDGLPGKRPNMAAFPRIGRRQLAAFPRIGKRQQQRLLATFPRIGRSGNRIILPLKGQSEMRLGRISKLD